MISHKVVDIKITYEPEHMEDMATLETKIEIFLNEIKGTKGVKISAKRHDVAVNVMLDEYGVDME
jgi:hypothetical protein